MITVLTSVYDTDPVQLRQAIESILSQTFADFEFLLLDDGLSLIHISEPTRPY